MKINFARFTTGRRSIGIALFCTFFMLGCANSGSRVLPPVSSKFQLDINQSFSDLPNYSRLYFQNGQRVVQGNLDRWTTYCRLHVFNRGEEANYLTSVSTGTIPISGVKNIRQSSNHVESGGFRLAFNNKYGGFGSFASGDGEFNIPSYYLYRVRMQLESPEQPDLQTLICSKKWATRGDYYPSLEEIKGALGSAITLTSG